MSYRVPHLFMFPPTGWHMDCLQPPLEKEPPGRWHCPLCPPLDMLPSDPESTLTQHDTFPQAGLDRPSSDPLGADPEMDIQVDDSSTDKSTDSDSDSDSDETVSAPAARRPQSVKKKKRRPTRRAVETHPPRPAKRMRLKVPSPPQPSLIVRLRLPPKGKGKEREDDIEHNIFEDLLPPAERDTTKTTIDNPDRARFEKSRLAAEVCNLTYVLLHGWLITSLGEIVSRSGSASFGCRKPRCADSRSILTPPPLRCPSSIIHTSISATRIASAIYPKSRPSHTRNLFSNPQHPNCP